MVHSVHIYTHSVLRTIPGELGGRERQPLAAYMQPPSALSWHTQRGGCTVNSKQNPYCKRLWSPGIDSEKSIQTAHVAWRAGTTCRVVVPARQAGNRFLGSLKVLKIRAQCSWSLIYFPSVFFSSQQQTRIITKWDRCAVFIFSLRDIYEKSASWPDWRPPDNFRYPLLRSDIYRVTLQLVRYTKCSLQ